MAEKDKNVIVAPGAYFKSTSMRPWEDPDPVIATGKKLIVSTEKSPVTKEKVIVKDEKREDQ